jgi:hypothetical protein
MPYIDIMIEDIYSDLSGWDKEVLADKLEADGYCIVTEEEGPLSAMEQLFAEDVSKIRRAYLTMSREDMDIINQIAKRY